VAGGAWLDAPPLPNLNWPKLASIFYSRSVQHWSRERTMVSSGRAISDIEVSAAPWRKSSWSAYNGGCVEVADLRQDRIGVRDTKAKGSGPVLVFTNAEWNAFLSLVKCGDLDFG
jgi:hypothetical protein